MSAKFKEAGEQFKQEVKRVGQAAKDFTKAWWAGMGEAYKRAGSPYGKTKYGLRKWANEQMEGKE